MPRSLTFLALVVCAGCAPAPDAFPPPPQRAPLTALPPTPFSYFLSMADPHAGAYLVQDVAAQGTGTWRWAFAHPVLRFWVPAFPRLRFVLDYSLPERTFRETGPVTLTIRVNGELLDRHRADVPGEQHYGREVPAGLIRPAAVNLVAIDPEPVWVSPSDHARLGFILSRAGFAE